MLMSIGFIFEILFIEFESVIERVCIFLDGRNYL